MRKLNSNPNVDNSDLVNYPDGRVKNNTGPGNGTPVNEQVYGDLHQTIAKAIRLYGIVGNGLPDNETNGFQILDAIVALASKNDFVLPLTLNSGVLNVPIKLEFMLENESVICKAGFNVAAETQIKGIGATVFAFTKFGSFKANDYVRLIKTASGVDLIRIGDSVSIDSMVSDANFLKKATQAEENAGAIDTKATTPLAHLSAFVRRVIGADSANYLATTSRNGLLSKEDKAIIDNFDSKVRNIGTVSGIDIESGTIGSTYTVSGDIASATLTAKPSNCSVIRIVVSNTMTNTSYYVRSFIESLSSSIVSDNSITPVVFKVINATTFDITIREFSGVTQNLKIHFELVKI